MAVQLVRVDDHRGVLTVTCEDDAAMSRVSSTVVDPWLTGHHFSETPSSVAGEIVFGLACATGQAWDAIDALNDHERVEHFVRGVAGSGTVWGLYADTWARASEGEGPEALPFWADRDLAVECIRGPWRAHAPRAIALSEFIEQWLPNMDEDKIVAVLMPTPTASGTIITAGELVAALRVGPTSS
ncbi:MAG: DUF2750 domain-containing protein [Nannocystaceae bacterium]|nr:DUF2750 domain-containing protein [Nannocystaceae bacterium]